MRNIIFTICAFTLIGLLLTLSIRGMPGNVDENTMQHNNYKENGPIELSPERGRFALTYTIAEAGELYFTLPVAQFATPDVAYENGQYVSLFAPGVSFIVLPGYYIGKLLGISQIGTYTVITIFAFLNSILIYLIARKLGGTKYVSILGSIIFLFATPAFAYAVSLYQHHISVFLLLTSIYLIIKGNKLLYTAIVWIIAGLAFVVDYPNLFLFIPIMLYSLIRYISYKNDQGNISINIPHFKILICSVAIIPLSFLLLYNAAAYNNPFQLSGGLKSVDYIDDTGKPVTEGMVNGEIINLFEYEELVGVPQYSNFFYTRNLINGLYVHLLSPDRGMLTFTPIILISVFGAMFLFRIRKNITLLLISIICINIILYSLWGDPWGGWAFGSRYLIPSYAIASILSVALIERFKGKYTFFVLFMCLFSYSVFVNTLGALTTSKIPPKVQVLALEEVTGKVEKYNYMRNYDYLNQVGLKSAAYTMLIDRFVPPKVYALSIMGLIVVGAAGLFNLNNYQKDKVILPGEEVMINE